MSAPISFCPKCTQPISVEAVRPGDTPVVKHLGTPERPGTGTAACS